MRNEWTKDTDAQINGYDAIRHRDNMNHGFRELPVEHEVAISGKKGTTWPLGGGFFNVLVWDRGTYLKICKSLKLSPQRSFQKDDEYLLSFGLEHFQAVYDAIKVPVNRGRQATLANSRK